MAEEIVNIQDLNGVGPVTAGKLRDAGYDSIASLAIAPIRELMEKAGLENSVAQKISRAARATIQTDFVTAKQLYERRLNLQRLSFASTNLDKLLGNGLETQAITEFVGEFGAGKSQICMKLSVNVQLPVKDGGLEGKALFIDTEGTFAAQRVYQMAQAMGHDADKILDGIIYSRVYNSDHQILTVDHAFKICQEENIKLLVVDSILSHFRGEYIGRESLSERQQRLNSHL
ncbi:MAG TPA: DNA repair and recombination protein RadA, partial [Candidatus Bathyarchaeia archaeon]